MSLTKDRIADIARYHAGDLDGRDVALVQRGKWRVVMRHAWPEGTDAQVWDGVLRAAMTLACKVADRHGRPVSVRTKDGTEIAEVWPRTEGAR